MLVTCDDIFKMFQEMALRIFARITAINRQLFRADKYQSFSIMSQPLDQIPDVDIDPKGVFKYILVDVHDDNNKQSKPIVRGYLRCQWHADIYDKIGNELKQYGDGLDTECKGGGRIKHNAEEKTILVYGFSQGFGKADHQLTVELLKKKYPDYEITYSDEGY